MSVLERRYIHKKYFLCFVKKFDFFREHDIKAVFLKLLCIYNMSKDKEVFLIVKYRLLCFYIRFSCRSVCRKACASTIYAIHMQRTSRRD